MEIDDSFPLRKLKRILVLDRVTAATQQAIMRSAIDSFCFHCKMTDKNEQKKDVLGKVRTCKETECPLHIVRPMVKSTVHHATLREMFDKKRNKKENETKISWTNEDEIELLDYMEKRISPSKIAKLMGRSLKNVNTRIGLLRASMRLDKYLSDSDENG
jgi:hypothetical protein